MLPTPIYPHKLRMYWLVKATPKAPRGISSTALGAIAKTSASGGIASPKAFVNATGALPQTERFLTMSPHVGNFTQELVEMAKAAEALPQVQHELRLRDNELNKAKETIASREIHILQLKEDIERLHSKLREAEVAKDAAETMFLEADDRTSRALEFIKATFGNAGSLIQALEPPKPAEPVVEPKPETKPVSWAEPKPEPAPVFPTSPQPSPSPSTQSSTGYGGGSSEPSGQSETFPTVSKETGTQTNAETSTAASGQSVSFDPNAGQSATHPTADATQPMASSSVPDSKPLAYAQPEPQPSGPFFGKRYVEVPQFATLTQWLNGGGTEADYHWRPNGKAAE